MKTISTLFTASIIYFVINLCFGSDYAQYCMDYFRKNYNF